MISRLLHRRLYIHINLLFTSITKHFSDSQVSTAFLASPLRSSLFFLKKSTIMGFRFPGVVHTKQLIQKSFFNTKDVPKGFLAVYVREKRKMKRFVIPVSYLNQPSFQDLLSQSEEEFGFDHPMGGLTIPCTEDTFINLISFLNA